MVSLDAPRPGRFLRRLPGSLATLFWSFFLSLGVRVSTTSCGGAPNERWLVCCAIVYREMPDLGEEGDSGRKHNIARRELGSGAVGGTGEEEKGLYMAYKPERSGLVCGG